MAKQSRYKEFRDEFVKAVVRDSLNPQEMLALRVDLAQQIEPICPEWLQGSWLAWLAIGKPSRRILNTFGLGPSSSQALDYSRP
jgi:hypothetical protein